MAVFDPVLPTLAPSFSDLQFFKSALLNKMLLLGSVTVVAACMYILQTTNNSHTVIRDRFCFIDFNRICDTELCSDICFYCFVIVLSCKA